MIYLIILSIFVNFIIFLNITKLADVIRIYDIPDQNRKLHKSPIPNIGGVIIFINILIIYLFHFFDDNQILTQKFFQSQYQYISFFLLSIPIFLVGMIDDKINLRANTKLTVLLIILTLAIWIDADLQISKINFSFLEEDIELKRFSVLFSLFSIIIFINAINMIDGIDLLAGIYLLFLILLIILRSDIDYLLIFISIGLINFLFLNFKKKIFLGDNGSIYCAYLVGYLFIKSVKYDNAFYGDEIFLAMMIPGIDLVRVAVTRMLNKRNPFSPDRQHLHHLISYHYGTKTALISIILLILIPNVCNLIFKNTLSMMILSFMVYSLIVLFLYKRPKLN